MGWKICDHKTLYIENKHLINSEGTLQEEYAQIIKFELLVINKNENVVELEITRILDTLPSDSLMQHYLKNATTSPMGFITSDWVSSFQKFCPSFVILYNPENGEINLKQSYVSLKEQFIKRLKTNAATIIKDPNLWKEIEEHIRKNLEDEAMVLQLLLTRYFSLYFDLYQLNYLNNSSHSFSASTRLFSEYQYSPINLCIFHDAPQNGFQITIEDIEEIKELSQRSLEDIPENKVCNLSNLGMFYVTQIDTTSSIYFIQNSKSSWIEEVQIYFSLDKLRSTTKFIEQISITLQE